MGRKAAVQARSRELPPAEPVEELDAAEPETDDAGDETLDEEAIASDNIGEQSVEINVETLIAELEAESHRGRAPDVHCARRKLNDYLERKRIAQDLEDFEDFEVDD